MSIQINGTSGISGVDGSATTPALQGTDTNTGLTFGTDTVGVVTGGSTRATVDSSGRLLAGTSSARSNFSFGTPTAQFETAVSSLNQGLSIVNNGGTPGYPPTLVLGTTRGTSVGSNTAIPSADYSLGRIAFAGADGTNLLTGARIDALSDGGWGTNDVPTRLVFSTTADAASSPTERMRIEADGRIRFSNQFSMYPTVDNLMQVGGNGARFSEVWAANGTIQTSDQRTKTEITTSSLGSDFIKALRPVSYKWIEGGNRPTGEVDEDGNWICAHVPGQRTHWGFIAQEVKQAVDAAGVDFGGWILTDKDDPESQQALRYDQFIAPLTKALQEALAKIEALETRVAQLEGGTN